MNNLPILSMENYLISRDITCMHCATEPVNSIHQILPLLLDVQKRKSFQLQGANPLTPWLWALLHDLAGDTPLKAPALLMLF